MKRRVGWCGSATLPSRARVALLLLVMSAAVAHAQAPDTRAALSWIDAYYADYSAMSAAPTGPAMDRWLDRYAPYVLFEDPTVGERAVGRDTLRKVYVAAFTGPMGAVRWTVLRRVASREWAAVEGWLEGTQSGSPFRARFSTWLKIHGGRIVHQIDYVDYEAMRRQIAGTEALPRITSAGEPVRNDDASRALDAADEFYRRYEAMPVLASPEGVARFTDLLADDFTIEDPTARLHIDGRERFRTLLRDLLAKGDHGVLHWAIDRRLTDGEWVAMEGRWQGVYRGKPFVTRFTTWLRVRGDRIAHQIDYLDYTTFRLHTSSR